MFRHNKPKHTDVKSSVVALGSQGSYEYLLRKNDFLVECFHELDALIPNHGGVKQFVT